MTGDKMFLRLQLQSMSPWVTICKFIKLSELQCTVAVFLGTGREVEYEMHAPRGIHPPGMH